jgi:hypothetical protein
LNGALFLRGILKALTARRPRVRIAIVHDRLMRWTLPLLLPARLVDWLMASMLHMLPKFLPVRLVGAPVGSNGQSHGHAA